MGRQEFDCCERHVSLGHAEDCPLAPIPFVPTEKAAPAGSPLHEQADRDADNVPSDCICRSDYCLGVPGEIEDCAACLMLDPEEDCIAWVRSEGGA